LAEVGGNGNMVVAKFKNKTKSITTVPDQSLTFASFLTHSVLIGQSV
jgi:hypothetical protein